MKEILQKFNTISFIPEMRGRWHKDEVWVREINTTYRNNYTTKALNNNITSHYISHLGLAIDSTEISNPAGVFRRVSRDKNLKNCTTEYCVVEPSKLPNNNKKE